MKSNQKGIAVISTILIIIIVAAVGFVGWRVYQYGRTAAPTESDSTTQTSSDTGEVKNTADLTAAEATLNEADIDKDLDTSEIDASIE